MHRHNSALQPNQQPRSTVFLMVQCSPRNQQAPFKAFRGKIQLKSRNVMIAAMGKGMGNGPLGRGRPLLPS